MNTHIYKYKLTFFLLFVLIAGLAKGQPKIDSMVYTVNDSRYIFACRKATPVDLFKAANLYVSPENGYWGDVRGVPYDGKIDAAGAIKERKYTDGNIFTPPTSEADTGTYKFYFYFTSSKGYCGITNNTRFVLNLYIGTYGCMEAISGELDNTHYFCFGSSVDMSPRGKHEFTKPVTIENLLLTYSNDPLKWKKDRSWNSDWVDIDVYSDSTRKNKIGTGDMAIDLNSAYDTTFYVIIHMGREGDFSDKINITVHRKSELEIYYSPDILKETRDFDIDERITIKVDTSNYSFKDYTFMLNSQNLNKYYFGGDITKNEITLSALVFTGSGAEDLIEIIATDKNNCIVKYDTNAVVNVPLPTVFTPDGDGINDIFLGGEKFRNREFHLDVSNRWGNLLYSGESGWDGTYRGNKVPPGTYMYVLSLKLDNGSTRMVKGAVTLIRESR
jgi:gliding motility-associated-like protein